MRSINWIQKKLIQLDMTRHFTIDAQIGKNIDHIQFFRELPHRYKTKKTNMTALFGISCRSELGPTLCNILYNSIFELKFEVNAYTLAFITDLAIYIDQEQQYLWNRWKTCQVLELTSYQIETLLLNGCRRKRIKKSCIEHEILIKY